ncbi:MAG: carbon-nitrogen hydrolase family protein, partial [Planctomycetales bacterium]|nr:carbon-nitrogen hydrolase family protein [Planctomycetales bacterium]
MRVAAVQIDITLRQVETNLAKIEDRLAEAAALGARLVVFPECAVTGYCYESHDEAWPYGDAAPGYVTGRLIDACRAADAFAVVGMLERRDGKLYNACALAGPTGLVGMYRKAHLPGLGVDKWVAPGESRWPVYEAAGAKVGLHICYDSAFPESARSMALDGADVLALPTNFPPGAECLCQNVLAARAMENGVYLVSANRVGVERGFRFLGQSKICGPDGETLAVAPADEEAIITADVDLARARCKRRVRVPGKHEIDRFADRRPELYGRLTAANYRQRT